ncbi:DUF2029 domain-containing protein [Nocardia stercoris]|uniref:DUF2029 domain-containing protein n=1 Tax=Nocardia stercoris TaxID=2483361 RepID=A0A3M2LI17_9NOCA|nr:DUF2029 domain-containing protein [Nocardia stercoris]
MPEDFRSDSPAPLASDLRSLDDRDLPSRNDTLAAAGSTLIGGPVGRHALIGRSRFWTPLRILLVFALMFLALGWFAKAPCIQQAKTGDGHYMLDWSNSRQYVAMCYSDTVPLYGAEHLNEGAFPYKKSWTEPGANGKTQVRYMEYPVLSGLYQYAAMEVGRAWQQLSLPGTLAVVVYFDVVAFGLAIAWLITVWASSQLAGGRRIWDAALIALSPLVAVHIFTNFDALATAFAATGLLAWARKRPILAGVLLGLGTAAKLYPVFLLAPIVLLCLRADSRRKEPGGSFADLRKFGPVTGMRAYLTAAPARPLRAAALAVVGAVLSWTAVNLPIAVPYFDGWHEFIRLNTTRGQDPDSIYNVISSFTGWKGLDPGLAPGAPPTVLNGFSLVLFLVACVGIAYIALTAPRRPRLMQLCFLVVAAFLLTNKVWSPQYSLWLVPLAALALPNRKVLLAWMTIDAFLWFPRMYFYLGVDKKGVPEQWFTGTVIVRDLAVLVMCALVLRQIYRPAEDPVRRDGLDDPAGGLLDGLPDPLLPWLPGFLQPRVAPVYTEQVDGFGGAAQEFAMAAAAYGDGPDRPAPDFTEQRPVG